MRLTRLGFIPLLCGSTAAFVAAPVSPSLAATLPGNCTGTVKVTCTFYYNGSNGSDGSARTWRVPAGVRSARFDLYGAQGGGSEGVSTGGRGGETAATLALTPGSVVTLLVGGRGTFTGGFNGGGAGSQNNNPGFGGGGASDVRLGGNALANRILVAAGGGGGADVCWNFHCSTGGAGGGRRGGDGTTSPDGFGTFGSGGTQTTGGAGSAGGGKGGRGYGGAAMNSGGGGGGGYFGGGGGGFDYKSNGAGGGGSSYFSANQSKVRNAVTKAGVRTGDGMIVITYTRPS